MFRQLCAAQNLQLLKLDPVRARIHPGEEAHCLQHIFAGFSRQPQDHMDDHLRPYGLQLFYSVLKGRQRITSVHCLRGPLVDRLQAQFDPDRLDPVQFFQHLQNVRRQAVRAGPYGQSGDFRAPDRLFIEGSQPLRLPVCVGEGLKIGDVFSL